MSQLSRKTGAQQAMHREVARRRQIADFNKSHQAGSQVTLARNSRSAGRPGVVTGPAREITTTKVYVPIAGLGLVPLDQIRTGAIASSDDAGDEATQDSL